MPEQPLPLGDWATPSLAVVHETLVVYTDLPQPERRRGPRQRFRGLRHRLRQIDNRWQLVALAAVAVVAVVLCLAAIRN